MTYPSKQIPLTSYAYGALTLTASALRDYLANPDKENLTALLAARLYEDMVFSDMLMLSKQKIKKDTVSYRALAMWDEYIENGRSNVGYANHDGEY